MVRRDALQLTESAEIDVLIAMLFRVPCYSRDGGKPVCIGRVLLENWVPALSLIHKWPSRSAR